MDCIGIKVGKEHNSFPDGPCNHKCHGKKREPLVMFRHVIYFEVNKRQIHKYKILRYYEVTKVQGITTRKRKKFRKR